MGWHGILAADTEWSGEILVDGDLLIPHGTSLRIRAGTKVRFSPKPAWSCAVFRSAPEGWPIETTRRELCDIVAQGRLADLLRMDKLESEAVIELPVDGLETARSQLLALPGVELMAQRGAILRLRLPTDVVPGLTAAVVEAHATLRELSQRRESLEELFVQKAVHVSTDGQRAAPAARSM